MTHQTTEALAILEAFELANKQDYLESYEFDAWFGKLRAALSSQPPAPTDAFDITLDEAATKLLAQTITGGDPDEDTWMRVRLLHGEGRDGHGLYVASADYPEEGAILLTATAGSTP